MSSNGSSPKTASLPIAIPMQDREIQNGGKLTVRDSQAAVFVNEGKVADAFLAGPVHAQHPDASHSDLPAKLGQSFQVALQIGRLFLLHSPADQSALGHAEPDHHSRQGIRRSSACGLSGSTATT